MESGTKPVSYGKDGFHHHADIPFASLAKPQIGRVPIVFAKAGISKDDHVLGQVIDQLLESRAIVNVSGVTTPTDNQTEMVEHIAQFATDNPAMMGEAFASDLLVL